MELKTLYREILNEHNINPAHKAEMQAPSVTLRGVNPSCGDDITLFLKTEHGKITDGSFTGSGCAISQASVDMMLDRIIGTDETEALRLADNFMAMIQGTATQEQIDSLDEAGALQDIAHMPARVKCAVLGWRTMTEMLRTGTPTARAGNAHCGTE